MWADHRRVDVAMAQQLLDRSNVCKKNEGQSAISERTILFGRPRVSPFSRLPTLLLISSWNESLPTTRPCCVAFRM